jgi:hypothetical protein
MRYFQVNFYVDRRESNSTKQRQFIVLHTEELRNMKYIGRGMRSDQHHQESVERRVEKQHNPLHGI